MTQPSCRYELQFRPAAARELRKLPRDVVIRIKEATEALRENPAASGCEAPIRPTRL